MSYLTTNVKLYTCEGVKRREKVSLVPRPSPAPVFDRLQYAKTEGEGLVNLTT